MKHNKNQNGSIFFYILIAIFLFAALTYFLSDSNRTNIATVSEEQAKVAAQEIIEYGDIVTNAVQKLLLRGCDETEISFEDNPTTAANSFVYTNINSPTDNSCHVYNAAGGNLNTKDANRFWFVQDAIDAGFAQFYVTARDEIDGIGDTCSSAECSEISMSVWGLKESVCLKINETLGINNMPSEMMNAAQPFTGSYAYIHNIGDDDALLSNKPSGCFYQNPCPLGECYIFYSTLLAR